MSSCILDRLTEGFEPHLPVLGVTREPLVGIIAEAPNIVCRSILDYAAQREGGESALIVEGSAGKLAEIAEDRLILFGARGDDWNSRLKSELAGLFKFIAEFEAMRYFPEETRARPQLNGDGWDILHDAGLRPVTVLGGGGHADCVLCEDSQGRQIVAKHFRSKKQFEQESWIYSLLGETNFSPRVLKTIPKLNTIVTTHIQATPIQKIPRRLLVARLPSILASFDTALEHLRRLSPALVHRDIKPNNVLLGDDRAFVIDYSSAETIQQRPWSPGDHLENKNKLGSGAYPFKAFEQLIRAEEQGFKIDVFGCAATIFWCLYGVPPYRNLASDVPVAQRFYERRLGLIAECLRRDFGDFGHRLAECLSVSPCRRSDTLTGLRELWDRVGSPAMARDACDLV